MTVRKLPEAPAKTQCCVPFDRRDYNNSYWQNRQDTYRHQGKDPSLCGRFATHELDGQLMCRRHTADALLVKMEKTS